MFSSSRYFTETLLVSDNRALPPQTGWTFKDYSVSPELSSYINDQLDIAVDIDTTDQFDTKKFNVLNIMQLAQQDIDEASTQSSSGWYYQAATPFFVGLTIRFAGVLLVRFPFRKCVLGAYYFSVDFYLTSFLDFVMPFLVLQASLL